MNKKAQIKFNKIEMEIVQLNKMVNDDSKNSLMKALQHISVAYDIAGGR